MENVTSASNFAVLESAVLRGDLAEVRLHLSGEHGTEPLKWNETQIAIICCAGSEIRTLLQQTDKGAQDGFRYPLLYTAGRYGHAEIIKELVVSGGADVNGVNYDVRLLFIVCRL